MGLQVHQHASIMQAGTAIGKLSRNAVVRY